MQNSKQLINFIEHSPSSTPKASIILLHGLGSSGHDFVEFVPHIAGHEEMRFIFPHAPQQPVTLNNGLMMAAWYDICGLSANAKQDKIGLEKSRQLVEELIEHEINRGVDSHRIILGGFSQGGALALHCGLRHPRRLGGIFALSTYLPVAADVAAEAHAINKPTSIFLAHGNEDPIVPIDWGHISRQHLSELGYQVEWRDYAMAHTVCPAEILDFNLWLTKCIK